MNIYARLVKVDEANHTVIGRAIEEIADRSGEIFDYATSAPLFREWSSEFSKVTDGKSVGNLRAMHGKVAAGKLSALNCNDDEKAIDIEAKVVDEAEWKKCLEGVYTGFSIGGRYLKKWSDPEVETLKRYTAQPSEISLVDAPCVPTARFTLVKADGAEEEHEFAAADGLLKQTWTCGITEHEHIEKDSARLCIEDQKLKRVEAAFPLDEPGDDYLDEGVEKAEGGKTVGGKVFPASDWAYTPNIHKPSTWKLRLTSTPGGAPDARIVGAAVAALGKGFRGNKVEIPAKDLPKVKARVRAAWRKANPDKKKADMPDALKVQAGEIEKGLYGVASFAQLLEGLNNLAQSQAMEEQAEGDGSGMSAKLKSAVATLGALLVQMTQEETSELTEGEDVEIAMADSGEIEKVALNRERFPALAECMAKGAGDGDDSTNEDIDMIEVEKLQQALKETSEGLSKAQEETQAQKAVIGEQKEAIDALTKRVDELAKSPAAGKGRRLMVIGKSQDTGDGSGEADLDELASKLDKMGPEDRSLFLIKLAQRNPKLVQEYEQAS